MEVWKTRFVKKCCISYDMYDFTMFYSFSVYKKKAENVKF